MTDECVRPKKIYVTLSESKKSKKIFYFVQMLPLHACQLRYRNLARSMRITPVLKPRPSAGHGR